MSAITSNDNSCIICQENILDADDTVRCNNEQVSHIFHRTCATRWARTRPVTEEQIACLLCREGHFLPIISERLEQMIQGTRARNQRINATLQRLKAICLENA